MPTDRLRAYLRDVLAYEQQAHELTLSVRHMPDPEHASSPPRWVSFEHDPQALFEALQAFQAPPADLQRVPHRVRLALVDGELETAILKWPHPRLETDQAPPRGRSGRPPTTRLLDGRLNVRSRTDAGQWRP